ncbi:MAG: ribonuclease HI family protein [bacterium]|nr:MAG: ribonuclease HI family protein [bacterium]
MVDGAARGNPGPAGAGFLVMGRGWTTVRRGEYLGEATNNVAEYQALLFGLEEAVKAGAVRVRICSDSELLVKQMTGEYRVKNPRLKDLFMRAQRMASNLKDVTYSHIPREENKEADRLANMAIDAEGPVSL